MFLQSESLQFAFEAALVNLLQLILVKKKYWKEKKWKSQIFFMPCFSHDQFKATQHQTTSFLG